MAKKGKIGNLIKEVLMESAALGGGGISANYITGVSVDFMESLSAGNGEMLAQALPVVGGAIICKTLGKSKKGGGFISDVGKGMIAVGIANFAHSKGIGNVDRINGYLPNSQNYNIPYVSPQTINGYYRDNAIPGRGDLTGG